MTSSGENMNQTIIYSKILKIQSLYSIRWNNRNVTKTSHFWLFGPQKGRSTYEKALLRPNLNSSYSKGGNVDLFPLHGILLMHFWSRYVFYYLTRFIRWCGVLECLVAALSSQMKLRLEM